MSDEIDANEAFRRLGIAANTAAQAFCSFYVEQLISGGMSRAEAWAKVFAERAEAAEVRKP
jgi:hypothetical protein